MTMLTAQDVSKLLHTSLGWVYRHKDTLGAFQPIHGGAVRFSLEKINDIIKGNNNAIPNEIGEMASKKNDMWGSSHKDLSHKGRGEKVGSRAKSKRVAKLHDPHNLLA